MKCPNCNKKFKLKLKFCPYCGKMISEQKFKGKANESNKESDKSHKTSKWNRKETEYWASKESDIFHRPSCEWAEEILYDNLIVYNTRQDAIDDGKEPCRVCYP